MKFTALVSMGQKIANAVVKKLHDAIKLNPDSGMAYIPDTMCAFWFGSPNTLDQERFANGAWSPTSCLVSNQIRDESNKVLQRKMVRPARLHGRRQKEFPS